MPEAIAEIDSQADILLRKKQAAEYCQKRFPHITVDTITHHVYKKKTLRRPIVRDHKAYWPISVLDAWLNENF
ncbi:hypothetical protein [Mycolicibacterium hippocampi]|nr:hypothetical protein [Mycolicibacterium hippocampi]